jgi:uncharacterized protein YbaA (DUF1428 family)
MQKSPLGKLNLRDAVNGLLLAVASAVMTAATQMLTKVPPVIDWKEIGTVAIITALSYIGKQITSNSNGELFKKD